MLGAYHLLARLLTPFIALWLHYRAARGKEDRSRLSERFGVPSLPRPSGPLAWIHAASVGEANSVQPLIQRLLETQPELHILVTTGTVSSAKMLAEKLPPRAFHQFVPIDSPSAVRIFLDHWKPNLAFWVESEFWPNLLLAARNRCPMILLNGRISSRSTQSWLKYPAAIRRILSCFTLILANSEEDAVRLRSLGGVMVQVEGNLKWSAPALDAEPRALDELKRMIGPRRVWLAASTHPGEEGLIAEAYHKLRDTYPDLLLILVPRHADRGFDVSELLQTRRITVARRSQQDAITPETDCYLADTMGELGIFYRLSPIVFIGGSLIPHGGQNPFEPARLDCAILYGPHMHNFEEFCAVLERDEAAVRLPGASLLVDAVDNLLRHPARQDEMAAAARQAVSNLQNVLERVTRAIQPYLDSNLKPRRAAVSLAEKPAPRTGTHG